MLSRVPAITVRAGHAVGNGRNGLLISGPRTGRLRKCRQGIWQDGTMADFHMADFELPTTETGLRARQDELVRALATENSAGGLAALSTELEAVQRRLEHLR